MVWQTGSLRSARIDSARLGQPVGMRGCVRAGLSRGSPLALGHPASPGSGEAAPDLYPTEGEEQSVGFSGAVSCYTRLAGSDGGKPVLWRGS